MFVTFYTMLNVEKPRGTDPLIAIHGVS